MTVLDVVLLVLLVGTVIAGYRRGALMQLAGLVGLGVGLVVGGVIGPAVARSADATWLRVSLALGLVLAFGALGDAIGSILGARLRRRAQSSRLERVDAIGGSVLSVAALVLVVWIVALNLAQGPFPQVARELRSSSVVRAIDAVMPPPPSMVGELRRAFGALGFPDVFTGLPPVPAAPVSPASGEDASRAIEAARGAVVDVEAEACGRIQQGSGFVSSSDVVLTNAHVVAGSSDPTVAATDRTAPATVVWFDPELDVAALRVDGLGIDPLPLVAGDVERGDTGAVLGYPGGGGLIGRRAAVRQSIDAVGRDIYGSNEIERDVLELQARVRPGNSGGPFVLADGRVAGMVFAASSTDPRVGYAIDANELAPIVGRAASREASTSTGDCIG